jgi:hypothetical protein
MCLVAYNDSLSLWVGSLTLTRVVLKTGVEDEIATFKTRSDGAGSVLGASWWSKTDKVDRDTGSSGVYA